MTLELSKDISAAIEKNLPAAAADVLLKALKQGKDDEASLAEYRQQNDRLSAQLSDATAELSTALSKLKEHAALDLREKAVAARELKAELTDLQTRYTSALENAKFARELALGLVRNQEFRETLYTSTNKNVPVNNNGYTSMQMITENETATKETKAS